MPGAQRTVTRTLTYLAAMLAVFVSVLMALPEPAPPVAAEAADDAPPEISFAIVGVKVFDGEAFRSEQDVWVEDSRIRSVGQGLDLPADLARVDGRGRTLVPGLIDGHVHTFGGTLNDAVRFGITTVLDQFTDPQLATSKRAARDTLARGDEADLFSAGMLATADGGHGTQYGTPVETVRADNPCDRIGPVLGPQQNLVQHMRALPHRDVAAAIGAVQASGAPPVVKLAFEFLVLTAARSGEVRGAQWADIDTEGHVWTIPATRTKAKREHRVPLCRRAEQILDAARALGDGHALVFPSGRGKRLADMALSGLLKDLAIGGVPHGFRSSFRDWTAEETNHPREVVEAALAHVVQNKVEAAYARSDLFERRRRLMDDWAAYLNVERVQAVTPHR